MMLLKGIVSVAADNTAPPIVNLTGSETRQRLTLGEPNDALSFSKAPN
jgi:hypothetical protein